VRGYRSHPRLDRVHGQLATAGLKVAVRHTFLHIEARHVVDMSERVGRDSFRMLRCFKRFSETEAMDARELLERLSATKLP